MANRDFKGIWIPKEVWLNEDLSVIEKLFLVEIDSLDNDNGCYASNKYFAEFFNISKGRCTQVIKSLERKGLIRIEYEREGKEIKRRIIRVVNKLNTLVNILNTPVNILNGPSKNTKQGYLENDEENNTKSNNTKSNNTRPSKAVKEHESVLSASFEDFWKVYPNKKSKQKAAKLFEKVIDENEATFEEIMEGVKKYAMEVDQKDTPKKYIKHPTTWLAQGCWADDYDLYEPTPTDDRYSNLPF